MAPSCVSNSTILTMTRQCTQVTHVMSVIQIHDLQVTLNEKEKKQSCHKILLSTLSNCIFWFRRDKCLELIPVYSLFSLPPPHGHVRKKMQAFKYLSLNKHQSQNLLQINYFRGKESWKMGSWPWSPFGLEDKAPWISWMFHFGGLSTYWQTRNERFGHNTGYFFLSSVATSLRFWGKGRYVKRNPQIRKNNEKSQAVLNKLIGKMRLWLSLFLFWLQNYNHTYSVHVHISRKHTIVQPLILIQTTVVILT